MGDEPFETEEERSARHALWVRQAVLFAVLLSVFSVALGFVVVWFKHGEIWWELLWLIPIGIAVLVVWQMLDMRKHW